MTLSQQDILDSLYRIQNKDRSYFTAADYKKFLPVALSNIPPQPDRNIFQDQMQSVVDQSFARLSGDQVRQQNRTDFQNMLEAQQRLARARQNLNVAGAIPAGNNPRPIGVRPGGVGVGQNIGYYNWNGHTIGLNKSVHANFIHFLNALAHTGYKINSVGGYRTQMGAHTGNMTHDLHQMGMAIDINPGQNPFRADNQLITNLPRGIGQLAARYGLVWGGNWRHSKDTMHFSVPYGGLE